MQSCANKDVTPDVIFWGCIWGNGPAFFETQVGSFNEVLGSELWGALQKFFAARVPPFAASRLQAWENWIHFYGLGFSFPLCLWPVVNLMRRGHLMLLALAQTSLFLGNVAAMDTLLCFALGIALYTAFRLVTCIACWRTVTPPCLEPALCMHRLEPVQAQSVSSQALPSACSS